jgi:glycosyltransferase involved in cell wall biosynthesis
MLGCDGFEVFWVAPKDDYTSRLEEAGHFLPWNLDRKGVNPWVELATFTRLLRLSQEKKPDLLLTWTPKPNIYGALVGRVLAVPAVPNVSGLGSVFIKKNLLTRIVKHAYKISFARCPRVFFQNSEDLEYFSKNSMINRELSRLLPGSGVDLKRFLPLPPRKADDFLFLFAGRLLGEKGIRELVEAIRRLKQKHPQVRLRIIGFLDEGNPSGIGREEFASWLSEGLVEFPGATDDIVKWLKDADCIVLPSYREGIPRILLEASACERPVITTDVPGCRDAIVDNETGFLCKPRDVDSLAETMNRMLQLSPSERSSMGRSGRSFMIQGFSEERVFEGYREILQKLFTPKRDPDE